MITYDLSCKEGHRFEGWFQNREDFDRQLGEGLIHCPLCDSTEIKKLLSAVAVHTDKGSQPAAPARGADSRKVESYFRALGDFVEKNFEDVGERFAEEARKIHSGQSEARSIRGETTPDEEEALTEEGIGFLKMALPKYDG
ncbi:MAG: DUF1178 domain-containing protein [Deltaproteobacteria bacterium]|nr:MAG: DUF1178 domain-containing protein [Deltaproteobacteria bacterium]